MQESFFVSGNSLKLCRESDESIANDPRGLCHIWEEPRAHARYIMGCDPTVGITGWSRFSRIDGDHKTDNGAIEIFRVDGIREPILKDGVPEIDEITKAPKFLYRDVQVAEFFAPVDSVEIARIANVLGRVWAGDSDDQCEFIFESYPGPGVLTLQELLRLGYQNLWQWELIADNVAEPTNHIGWRSWRESQKILWFRSRRHLLERRAKIYSPWLVAEYANAVIDIDKMRAKSAYGFHDDLMQAANMCFWAGHKWTYDPERTWEPVTESPVFEAQRAAPVIGEYRNYRDQWAEAIDGWD